VVNTVVRVVVRSHTLAHLCLSSVLLARKLARTLVHSTLVVSRPLSPPLTVEPLEELFIELLSVILNPQHTRGLTNYSLSLPVAETSLLCNSLSQFFTHILTDHALDVIHYFFSLGFSMGLMRLPLLAPMASSR
jgi:hypothetical protein